MALLVSEARAATLHVDGTGTDGYATIAEAVAMAESGDTITLAAGTYTESLELGEASIEILGIEGSAHTVLDASGLVAAAISWEAGASENLHLEGMTIRNTGGRGVVGSGGVLELVDVVFEDLGARELKGGSVALVNGKLSVASSLFDHGTADQGGLLWVEGSTVSVSDTVFVGGLATVGGAIYLGLGSTLDLIDCELDLNNTAGIENHGAGIYAAEGTTLTVSGSTFTDNLVDDFTSSGARGGGIYGASGAFIEVSDSAFLGNEAHDGSGIFVGSHGVLTVTGTTIQDNYGRDGTGISGLGSFAVTVVDSTFGRNVSIVSYGAAHFHRVGSVELSGNVWADNVAVGGEGGALGLYGTGPVSLEDEAFINNVANHGGGAVIAQQLVGELTLNRVIVEGNVAVRDAGGGLLASTSGSILQVSESEFIDNQALLWGGGLRADDMSTELADVVFTDNVSTERSGGGASLQVALNTGEFDLLLERGSFRGNSAGGDGGGLHIEGFSEVTVSQVELVDNVAGNGGGGVLAHELGAVNAWQMRLDGNIAVFGGGLHMVGGSSGSGGQSWRNLEFVGNIADSGGAACAVDVPSGSLSNSSFVGNRALDRAAALCLDNSALDVRNNIFVDNVGAAAVHVRDDESAAGSTFGYNAWHGHDDGDLDGVITDVAEADEFAIFEEADFSAWDAEEGYESANLVLLRGSALLNRGDPELSNPDGSPSDPGAYGGPLALTSDADADGHEAWVDCAEDDTDIFPGALERWYDGLDQDCSGGSDFDADGDGVDSAENGGTDCNDADPDRQGRCPLGTELPTLALPPQRSACAAANGSLPAWLFGMGALALGRRRSRSPGLSRGWRRGSSSPR